MNKLRNNLTAQHGSIPQVLTHITTADTKSREALQAEFTRIKNEQDRAFDDFYVNQVN